MTKKAVREKLDAALKVGETITQERKKEILDLFAAQGGAGRGKQNVEDLIKVENGKTVAILDTVANVWLPADKDLFYEEKVNPDPKMNGLKNHSKAREKLVKEHQKLKKHIKDLMWEGVIQTNALTREEINMLTEKLPKIDYSRIVPFGQPNAGEIKPSKEVEAFEALVEKAKAKIEAKKTTADENANKSAPKAPASNPSIPTK